MRLSRIVTALSIAERHYPISMFTTDQRVEAEKSEHLCRLLATAVVGYNACAWFLSIV